MAIALASGFLWLVASFYLDLPSGPSIILAAGAIYAFSVLFGARDGVMFSGRS